MQPLTKRPILLADDTGRTNTFASDCRRSHVIEWGAASAERIAYIAGAILADLRLVQHRISQYVGHRMFMHGRGGVV